MTKFLKSNLFLFFVVSVSCYLLFFNPILNPKLTIYSGKDTVNFHYPTRFYIYEKLKTGQFPFWTERIFSGFPIYADLERGITHPINLSLIFLFGPVTSYKIIHFLTYLLGSFGLYSLLKKRGVGILGFLASNLVYFFSFFALYHQQHFNTVLTFYLLPMLIYITHLFLEDKRVRYVIYSVLLYSYVLYLGNIQTVFLIFLGQLLYFVSHSKKADARGVFRYYAVFAVLAVAVSLPLILPATELVVKSVRKNIHYTQGSLSPLDVSALAYPFPYGEEEYFGTQISNESFKHEVYMYVGITVLVLSAFSYSKLSDKDRKFVNLAILTFLILGFVKYLPIMNSYLPFPISIFRYWGRSAVILVFALSLLAGVGINKIKVAATKLTFTWLAVFVILFGISLTTWLFGEGTRRGLWVVKNSFNFNQYTLFWLFLLIVSVALVAARKNIPEKILRVVFVVLISVDIVVFGLAVLKDDFINVEELRNASDTQYFGRNINFDSPLDNNKGLYYNSWGILGYSPLVSENYIKKLSDVGMENEKTGELSEEFNETLVNNLYDLGVKQITNNGQAMGAPSQSFIANKNVSVSDEQLSEGHFAAKISVSEDTLMKTYIRNYTGWELHIDGVLAKNKIEKDSFFVEFQLPAGTHTVTLSFSPKIFYVSLALTAAILTSSTYFLYKNREKLFD